MEDTHPSPAPDDDYLRVDLDAAIAAHEQDEEKFVPPPPPPRAADMFDSKETKHVPSRQCRILAFTVSMVLAVAVCFAVYFVATSPDREECSSCPYTDDSVSIVIPSFFWYSSWNLITTCITWGLYVRRRFFSSSVAPECLLPTMFRLSLPLSVAVSIGYTVYMAGSDLGRERVNGNICYTVPVLAAATPKENTSLAEAIPFLFFSCFTNVAVHYITGAINLALYFKHSRRETWNPLWPLIFITVESFLIITVHELVEPVYCTGNIFLTCLWMTILF